MAKTLGQQLDDVQAAIEAALSGQKIDIGDKSIETAPLHRLQEREMYLLDQIAKYGRDYMPGRNARPLPRRSRIVFG